MKRAVLEQGLLVLIRAGLANMEDRSEGLMYTATDRGPVFVDVLEAPYVESLRERAEWVVHHYSPRVDTQTATREIIKRSSTDFVQAETGHE